MTLCKSRDASFLFRLTLTIFPVAIIPGLNLQFLKLEFHIPLKSPPGSNRLYDAFDLISHSHFYICILPNKILEEYFSIFILVYSVKLSLPVQVLLISDPLANLIDILFFEKTFLLYSFLWIYIIIMEKL